MKILRKMILEKSKKNKCNKRKMTVTKVNILHIDRFWSKGRNPRVFLYTITILNITLYKVFFPPKKEKSSFTC